MTTEEDEAEEETGIQGTGGPVADQPGLTHAWTSLVSTRLDPLRTFGQNAPLGIP